MNLKQKFHAKQALRDTIEKLRADIEKVQRTGGYPHDYSLGFTNGVIFVEHRLFGKAGQPKFYDQKMSINELPRPMKFEHEARRDAQEEKEHDELVDQILVDAQVLAAKFPDAPESTDLKNSLAKLDAFLDKKIEKIEKKKEVAV